jgi:outer membrane protein TolC
MKKLSFPFLMFFIIPALLFQSLPAQSHLDGYIDEGLTNNQLIRQQAFKIDKAFYALKEARTLYLPRVGVMADYFLANGGRTVDFPAGDLLNPVYATLNGLTESSSFPPLQNESILLNPNNFYDAKIRTSMPLMNAEIMYNKKIKQHQVNIGQIELEVYKRELVKDIKVAYFNYLKAFQAVDIYKSALELARENKRINGSLFNNDKVNRTAVLRADNEYIRYNTRLDKARQLLKTAQAYFNFLLNKDQSSPILIDSLLTQDVTLRMAEAGPSNREELKMLGYARLINEEVTSLNRSFVIPKISTFLDLGSQAFSWEFNRQSRYYLFGISLKWDLLNAGQNKYKIRQSELDYKVTNEQTALLTAQIQLQLTTALHKLNAAHDEFIGAKSQLESDQKLHKDFLRLYKEGQALYIELLDAQNQKISSELEKNISLYEYLSCMAEVERANASYLFSK